MSALYKLVVLGGLALQCLSAPAMAQTVDPLCAGMADLSGTAAAADDYLVGTFAGKDGWLFSPASDFHSIDSMDVQPIAHLAEALKAHGTTLIYLSIPDRPVLYAENLPDGAGEQFNWSAEASEAEYQELIGKLQEAGVVSPDLLSRLKAAKAQAPVYFKRDTHWTTFGARTVAQAIADAIVTQDSFPNTGKKFETAPIESEDALGSYGSVANLICKSGYPPEAVERSATEDTAEVGLLDDEDPATIAIVGTSFSYRKDADFFNFAGAVSEFTGEDVLNFAVPGGGMYSSITNFLESDFFQETPPKYLIWENSRGAVLPTDDHVRQLVGSIYGGCDDAPTELPAVAGAEVVFNTNLPLHGPDYYLALRYSDTTFGQHWVTLNYADGKYERVKMDRGARSDANGRFYLELGTNPSGISGFGIRRIYGDHSGTVSVSICKAPEGGTGEGNSTGAAVVSAPTLPEITPSTLPDLATHSQTGIDLELTAQDYKGNPKFRLALDGRIIGEGEVVAALGSTPQTFHFDLPAGANPNSIEIWFTNDLNEGVGADRNLALHAVYFNGVKLPLADFERLPPLKVRRLADGTIKITANYAVIGSRPATGWPQN